MFFPLIVIYSKEKKVKTFFYNNLAIRAVIIYFTIWLHDVIKTLKSIKSIQD